jgi:hypothetical protein
VPRSPERSQRPVFPAVLLALSLLPGCGEAEEEHPWIRLGPDSPFSIVESSGTSGGQVVILMPPEVSREEALGLGQLVRSQVPEGATVNVRLYNDETTARGWRTAPAEWTLQHLLVVVQVVPDTGLDEVRWVGPEPDPASEPAAEPPAP